MPLLAVKYAYAHGRGMARLHLGLTPAHSFTKVADADIPAADDPDSPYIRPITPEEEAFYKRINSPDYGPRSPGFEGFYGDARVRLPDGRVGLNYGTHASIQDARMHAQVFGVQQKILAGGNDGKGNAYNVAVTGRSGVESALRDPELSAKGVLTDAGLTRFVDGSPEEYMRIRSNPGLYSRFRAFNLPQDVRNFPVENEQNAFKNLERYRDQFYGRKPQAVSATPPTSNPVIQFTDSRGVTHGSNTHATTPERVERQIQFERRRSRTPPPLNVDAALKPQGTQFYKAR